MTILNDYLTTFVFNVCKNSSAEISVKGLFCPAIPALAKKISSLLYVLMAWDTTSSTPFSFAASNVLVWTSTLGYNDASSRL